MNRYVIKTNRMEDLIVRILLTHCPLRICLNNSRDRIHELNEIREIMVTKLKISGKLP